MAAFSFLRLIKVPSTSSLTSMAARITGGLPTVNEIFSSVTGFTASSRNSFVYLPDYAPVAVYCLAWGVSKVIFEYASDYISMGTTLRIRQAYAVRPADSTPHCTL